MKHNDVADNPAFWFAVMIPFVATFIFYYFGPVFLNSINQMQFPIFVPRFDPIGIDLRWIWQLEQEWAQSGFSYLNKGTEHFPPFILLLFVWSSKLSFQDTYKIFSLLTLTLYLVTAIAMPYLITRKCNLDKKVWLISIPFALFGLTAYGFQFEIERGQWNLVACCLGIWGCYLYWQGSLVYKCFAIALLTIAIQMKLYPAIFILAFFACRKNLNDGVITCFAVFAINIGLLFVFGWNGFVIFLHSVASIAHSTSYGIAQTSISAFLWLISQNHIDYLPLFKFLLVIYSIFLIFTIYLLIFKKSLEQERFISLLVLLTIIGLIVPSHSNDYKLSLMPLILSIMSPQLIMLSNLRDRYKQTIPLVVLMLFFGFSTFYSYATKPSNMFIQNNVSNLLLLSFLQCVLVIFIFNNELIKYSKKIIFATLGIVILGSASFLIYQKSDLPERVIKFNGSVSTDQMKSISLVVKVTKLRTSSLSAVVVATNNYSSNFNTVNTSGLPVRMSWRFVKLSDTGEISSAANWVARKDLRWTIEPGGSKQVEISADLPNESGRYLFEVTIVQDLVSFFHDAGMPIATAKVSIVR